MDPFGYLDVGLGGNCDCRCGILYAPVLGVVFVGLVSFSIVNKHHHLAKYL